MRTTRKCRYCDTDFVGTDGYQGARYADATRLVQQMAACWPTYDAGLRFAVLTGGERFVTPVSCFGKRVQSKRLFENRYC